MIDEGKFDSVLRKIRYLNKLIDADFEKRLSEVGLTAQQGRIFLFIYWKNKEQDVEIHQNDIENEFHLSKSTVSGLVKRLEKTNVIERIKQHPYAILKPTSQGDEIINHLRANRKKTIEQLFTGLNEEEKEQMMKLIEKMIVNMGGGSKLCGTK